MGALLAMGRRVGISSHALPIQGETRPTAFDNLQLQHSTEMCTLTSNLTSGIYLTERCFYGQAKEHRRMFDKIICC